MICSFYFGIRFIYVIGGCYDIECRVIVGVCRVNFSIGKSFNGNYIVVVCWIVYVIFVVIIGSEDDNII